MIEVQEVETLIKQGMATSSVTVVDLTGTKDHFRVEVISDAFAEKTLLEQHRMVQSTVQEAINDGRIHAISFVTSTG